MLRHGCAAATLAVVLLLAGCSSGSAPPAGPSPGGDAGTVQVGPLLIGTASVAGFTATPLPSGDSLCAFVALHGAQINRLAAQALLDRVLFSSNRDGFYDLWMCNLDGSNPVQLTNNAAWDGRPQWSADGTQIAFQRSWPGQDTEIVTMNADGSTIRALTDNTIEDAHPTWSPDARRIAFESNRTGTYEIFTIYTDGSSPTNITNAVGNDTDPDWAQTPLNQRIVFSSTRDIQIELYTVEPDGRNATRVTNDAYDDVQPCWAPNVSTIAYRSTRNGTHDVFICNSGGTQERNFSNTSHIDQSPCYSSDSKYIAFTSDRDGDREVYLQEANEPWRVFRLTSNNAGDNTPDLGSPTMQTERVLIGPPGSDWGGLNPIWADAPAGIVAIRPEGYAGFVRIGVRAADVGTLEITPLENVGWATAGAVHVFFD